MKNFDCTVCFTWRWPRKMVVLEKVQEEIKQQQQQKEQLRIIPVCLKTEVVTGIAENVHPELRNTAEHDVACCWRWYPESLVSPPGSRSVFPRVTHPVGVIYSFKYTPYR